MRKIMRAHNRIIQRSLLNSFCLYIQTESVAAISAKVELVVFRRVRHTCCHERFVISVGAAAWRKHQRYVIALSRARMSQLFSSMRAHVRETLSRCLVNIFYNMGCKVCGGYPFDILEKESSF